MIQYTAFELDNLFEHHFFSNLDYFFAKSLAKAFDEKDPIVLASCAFVSKLLFEGHICLNISAISGTTRAVSETGNDLIKFPDLNSWINALQNSLMVSDNIQTPMVLDSYHRFYFSKYYDFQNRLARNITQRIFFKSSDMDEANIDEIIGSYFTQDHKNNQRKAVKHAANNYFTIISGGPGTGKTYVTKVIKKIFLSFAKTRGLPVPKIICVAPTGKAASKMDQGSTIHSILKPLKNSPGFYYNKNNTMQTDVIIIDEASMIDIILLTRLLEAVPLTAKVIVLGDVHQLSSIQAGSVFSDICKAKGMSPNLFFLDYNFRSKGKTGIENLSKAINENDARRLEDILIKGRYPDVVFKSLKSKGKIDYFVNKFILKGYKPFVSADTVEEALNELDDFKILCAHNKGEFGTLQVNHLCEKILRVENNFGIQGKFKRIIMININDYKKGLFNGDTGIVFEKKVEVNTFFKTQDNTIKQYRASDLSGFDPAFAITIHKSQGSEFSTVLMILPDRISPVVTRQLLYTGITRAKTKVIIVGDINIIKNALNLSVKRNSGLSMCLEKEILNNEKSIRKRIF
ncbi:MAG: AAA family ATPase [Desulfobacula sp.]|uniref:ATP-dependent DNA helicase n=1 Tax=Desulfobacula sp. TaxID=2593537 RepID=UPI001EB11477|nr:AAA family ATPase [Desulfobacula sp.]